MLLIPIWIAAVATQAAPAAPPGVDLEFVLTPERAVEISLRVPGEADGSTRLDLAQEWGGWPGAREEIVDLRAWGGGGEPLLPTRVGRGWLVRHAPGEPLRIRYRLAQAVREPLPPGRNDYRNRMEPDLFHAIGHHCLVLPEALQEELEVSLRWTGFGGWTAASSLGPGTNPRSATMAADDLRSCFFIAGEPERLRLATRDLRGNTVGLVVIDAEWGFADGRLLDLLVPIVAAERDFFNDHTDPWFLVALTPNGGHASGQGFSFGGTGLTNCFALFCNTGLDLEPGGAHAGPINRLLAHEYFHNWNGRKIRIDAPEGAAYWFSEGFTDFYTRRLLRRAGIWSDAEWLESLNESVAAYDRNPERLAPNQRIVDEFWSDRDIGALPYRRGDLLALALDTRIRERSGGSASLDDLMRSLHDRAARGEAHPTPDEFYDLVASYAGEEFASAFRGCAENGDEIPLPEEIAEPALFLTTGEVRESDDGFDIASSREAGTIVGVRKRTGAYEAGLRDGQRLVSVERLPPLAGPPRLKVTTSSADGSESTTIFEAVSEPRTVRRYSPRAD